MTVFDNSAAPAPTRDSRCPEGADARREIRRWGRFILALVLTAIVLVPVIGVLWLSLRARSCTPRAPRPSPTGAQSWQRP